MPSGPPGTAGRHPRWAIVSRDDPQSEVKRAMTIIEIPVTHTVDLRRQPAWMVERGLARAMAHCRPGDIVEAWSTDAMARDAIGPWVSAAGHRLIGIEARDGYDETFVEAGR